MQVMKWFFVLNYICDTLMFLDASVHGFGLEACEALFFF